MHLHPTLGALCEDDSPQRAAQVALHATAADWRAGPAVRTLTAELAQFAQGGELDDFAMLSALLTDHAGASRFAADLVGRTCAALTDQPLGHVALRHFTDGTVSTLMLAGAGGTSLALIAIDGAGLARRTAPTTVSFAPCHCWEIVLAGTADAALVYAPTGPRSGEPLAQTLRTLAPGDTLDRDSARQSLIVNSVENCLVSLRLQRRRDREVAREFALADGALLHQAAGSARDSRLELAAALLGRMGRSDAAPLLAAMAEESGTPALRWQALRECLALDSRAGFVTLSGIARRPADPLAMPAGALRAQLLEAHPELGMLEPCRS